MEREGGRIQFLKDKKKEEDTKRKRRGLASICLERGYWKDVTKVMR